MLINIWVSLSGLKNFGDNGYRYPYKAKSPVDRKLKLFKSIKDVYKELMNCYDELTGKTEKFGEALYVEHFYYANTYELIDKEYQNTIKKYNFCKAFHVPPYPSLDTTPANVMEDFMTIEKEVNDYNKKIAKQKRK